MDLKKEIKLSDLVPKRRKATEAKVAKPKKTKAPASKRRRAKPTELVGLKIGASQLAAARIVGNGGNEVVQLVREPLRHGIVAGGEVRDPAALGDALADFFVKHRLPRKGVRLGLANSRVGVRAIEISGIEDERQLENAIGYQAHETLSVPLNEAVIDWHELGDVVDEEGVVTKRVLLVVAYRDSVDRYLAAVDQAGISLAGIDLEAFALLRAVYEPSADDERREVAAVAVSVGHERTTLAISDGRVCEFARVLEWGGSNLSAAIARALKISPAEADDLKHELSLDVTNPSPRNAEAMEAARFELQSLVRELFSSLRFYQSQTGSLAIGEIMLSGGTAEMAGFAAELERELGVPVRVADPFARVSVTESVDVPSARGSLAIAIGLGIED